MKNTTRWKWTGVLLASVTAIAATALVACCHAKLEERQFGLSLRGASVTVYPAVVRQVGGLTYDAAAAQRLAQWLQGRTGAVVTVAPDQIALPPEPQMNEQRLYRSSRDAFGRYVAALPRKTDYSMLAEYLITPTRSGGQRAGGIHLYVVNAQGEPADKASFGLNDHHQIFAQANPTTPGQCTATLLAALQDRWALGEASK